MKCSKIFKLAMINNKNYKKLTSLTLKNIVVSSLLLLLILSFGSGINLIMKNVAEKNYEEKQIQIRAYIRNGPQKIKNIVSDNIINSIRNQKEVKSICIKGILDCSLLNDINSDSNIQTADIILNNIKVQTNCIQFVNPKYSTFQYTLLMERREKYGKFSNMVAGREFNINDTRSIIIDEAMLYWLGYQTASSIIGKEITIVVGNNQIKNLKIIGVHNYNLGTFANIVKSRKLLDVIKEEKQISSVFNYPAYITQDVLNELPQSINEKIEPIIIVQANKIQDVSKLLDYIKTVTNNSIWCNQEGLSNTIRLLDNVKLAIMVLAIITLLVALINMINMLIVKIIKQKKVIHIMEIVGYRRWQIILMYVFDNFLIICKAIGIYTILVFVFTVTVDRLMFGSYSALSDQIATPFIINVKTLLAYSLFIIIIFIGSVTIIANMNIKKNVYLKTRSE